MRNGKSERWAKANGDTCLICGSPYIQIHHVFEGTANRKQSEKWGYVVPLCREHHTGSNGVHFNKSLDLELKRAAQEDFEERHGTRKEFREIFGRSYL